MTGAAAALLALAAGAGCSPGRLAAPGPHLSVVVTISTFVSLVRAVGGDRVVVSALVPVGASPEDYQPTPADVVRLHDADILFQNGAGLESWLARTLENARRPDRVDVILSAGIPLRGKNPHVWMDPELTRTYVRKIEATLAARDPGGKDEFARNARALDARLVALEKFIAARIATIPPQSRSMIIFHGAFDYYNARFGLRTVGVLEASPGREPSPKYLADLIALARENHVRAVFSEPEYSAKLVHTLAENAGIRVVANLYDDSIGADPRVHDYESMLRYDTQQIAVALGGR